MLFALVRASLILLAASAQIHVDTRHNPHLQITRNHPADLYVITGGCGKEEMCFGGAKRVDERRTGGSCSCQCPQQLPLFRDDMNLCVDDIPEEAGRERVAHLTNTQCEVTPTVQAGGKRAICILQPILNTSSLTAPYAHGLSTYIAP
ncbi:hypothetical protein AAG570_013235 [Ranatra chinensis]|uniref:Shavenoid isoform B-like N-terminal domain-containing protein n=1 Tax=Ranatra chinensis TaxID=642074 RepID=A0ABD0YUR0_9HEMI